MVALRELRGLAAARLSRSARSAARSASIRACSLRTRCQVLRAVAALAGFLSAPVNPTFANSPQRRLHSIRRPSAAATISS
jgi:hypothetical protein